MTFVQYTNLKLFPMEMISICSYYVNGEKILRRGQVFIAVRIETIGKNDFSVIDDKGHPHYYDSCNPLYPEAL